MKVKCISIFNEITKKFQDKSDSLTIGKEYHVIEVDINPNAKKIWYRILDNDKAHKSGLYASSNFEIISSKIPTNWCINELKDHSLTLGPKLWMKLGFWEDFYDKDEKATEIYEREVKIMLKEEGEPMAEKFKIGEVFVVNLDGKGGYTIK